MTADLVAEISELALSLAAQVKGKAGRDAAVADTLLQMGRKVAQAYSKYAGKPLDPGLIQPEEPVG